MHNDTKKEEGIAWNARNKKIPRMSSRSKMVRIHPSYETSHDPCTHLESRRRRWNEIDTDASFLSPLCSKGESPFLQPHTPLVWIRIPHPLFFSFWDRIPSWCFHPLSTSLKRKVPWDERMVRLEKEKKEKVCFIWVSLE